MANRPAFFVVLAAGIASAFSALAAELPSRATKSAATPTAQTCEINGRPGVRIAGGDACVRIGGYVGAGVAAGNLTNFHGPNAH
jgi:hypothetical protein